MASDSSQPLTREEAKRILRRLELEAFAGIVTAFRAQGDLDRAKKEALRDLASHLSISTERHKAEIRRAVSDDQLNAVAECINGPSSGIAWSAEGRRMISMMPRLVPQTALTAKATVAANMTQLENNKIRRGLAAPSADGKAKPKLSSGAPETQFTIKPQIQKLDAFNNNVNAGFHEDSVKSDSKSPDMEKIRKKKRHPTANKILPAKLHPSLLTNKATPKGPSELYKSPSTFAIPGSPSKIGPSSFPKFHSKPIILQRSSPFKPHHNDSSLSTPSVVTTSTALSTPSIPVSTFSIPTRPTITSFTTSPSGGLIPVQYNSASGVSPGLSASKVKFKAPMPRQRGKPSKFKALQGLQGSARSTALTTGTVASDPINVLATPTGIPITPISPNKTQGSPVSAISSLTQSSPCTVKVVQIPKTTLSPTTAQSPGASTNKTPITSQVVTSSKSPAQRVLTFSNLPGHSGQQLKIASIPNVLQQSGALASTAKLVSISKSVPMATGFKMIAVTTMVPGSSQVKTVYIATPIMSLTKSVTHGTGSIISTSVHNRKRVSSTTSSSSATTTTPVDNVGSKSSAAAVQTTNTVTSVSTVSTEPTTSKTMSSIISVAGQTIKVGGNEVTLGIVSHPTTSVPDSSGKTTCHVSSGSTAIVVSALSGSPTASVRVSTETLSLLSKHMNEKVSAETSNLKENELVPTGDALLAHLAAKFTRSNHNDFRSDKVFTQVKLEQDGNGQSCAPIKVTPLASSDPGSPTIDLSARETLDGEETMQVTGSSLVHCSSSVSTNSKSSVVFLSSEDGIWSSSNKLCKSETSNFQWKGTQSESSTTSKKIQYPGRANVSVNSIVPISSGVSAALKPPVCRCNNTTSGNVTIFSDAISPTSVQGTQQNRKSPIISIAEDSASNSPDKKRPRPMPISGAEGEKSVQDPKPKNLQRFDLLGGDSKNLNKFIPIQNQTKPPACNSNESSQYTSTLRDLNKLFFNQGDSSSVERRKSVDLEHLNNCSSSNGPHANDSGQALLTPTSMVELDNSRPPDLGLSSESCSTNTSSSDTDSNFGNTERFNYNSNLNEDGLLESSPVGKKRKLLDPSQRFQSGWVRSAQSLLQKVSRYRGSNKQKGEMNASSWFARPVDPDDAPNYYKIIKNPMDFSTVKRKLEDGSYRDYTEFFADMQLIKTNCHTYNPPEHPAIKDCNDVFAYFETEYKKTLERWQRCHVSPTKKLKTSTTSMSEEVVSKI